LITFGYNYFLTTQLNLLKHMKINFAQVPADDVDMFGDDGLFGPDHSGNFYYNFVEFGTNPGGTEEIAVQDGCGRYMPIAVEHIPSLIDALLTAYRMHLTQESAKNELDLITSDHEMFID
jgi:hypothetical protein